ncbi:hypothetical protein CRV04_00785 [Candidatus Marinarcus aquaticus]|uniref:Lipid/polyisoprenoid-binding YceI-like domain-containing protein n=2 Tax=Candidatus Marinarcus aquaticus TaxID=2044504 RepID=A0A4Q0XU40_9BACT|nr:hypothetical protein CRV04_00785 [Candidatus Marinarcus aquaticus]
MNMKFKIFIAVILTALSLNAQSFKVDTSHTKVGFKVKHLMISNVVGHFEEFNGMFDYDEKKGTLTAFKGEVKVNSIDTSIEKRDNHLRSADFFDAQKFPIMTLEMLSIDGEDMIANLTIKGITKKVEFEFENGGSIVAPNGVKKAGFSLETKINRKDFGLNWNKVLEAGGVVVGDIVRINLEIEGDAIK